MVYAGLRALFNIFGHGAPFEEDEKCLDVEFETCVLVPMEGQKSVYL